ncbi:unnamed protein product [Ostreobium quekettii]|uniref:Aspartate/glutamate/uridylate kinase domain-containing protein n=1 Tax=Ostreobium quekettii TaxID=121088 RepID=A0A8S1IWL3_9CHLO|nr:unnamed protein product [Ostreobium quekettii]|eukprot:evm.model.scf_287.10 EVM.evm.TU.scf_287.10   scf_287:76306-77509(+)
MAGRDEHGERGGSDAAVNGPAVAQIVKIGGAALTDKGTPECLREGALRDTARMLRRVMDGNGPARRLVVVHGAGSFGHIQASRSGVAGGGLDSDAVRRGFVETRLSVTKLNHHVVAALAKEGLPAVGVPICGYWTTSNRQAGCQGWLSGCC